MMKVEILDLFLNKKFGNYELNNHSKDFVLSLLGEAKNFATLKKQKIQIFQYDFFEITFLNNLLSDILIRYDLEMPNVWLDKLLLSKETNPDMVIKYLKDSNLEYLTEEWGNTFMIVIVKYPIKFSFDKDKQLLLSKIHLSFL